MLKTPLLYTRSCLLAVAAAFLTASAGAAVIDTPTIQVQSLTHTRDGGFFPFMPPSSRDSLSIGDGNYTGGGAFSINNIANGDTATMRIEAAPGQAFIINHAGTQFGFNLFFQTATQDQSTTSGGTATFENLVGAQPDNSYSFLRVSNNGQQIGAEMYFTVTEPISFTAIEISIPVASNPPAGPRNFAAVSSYSEPSLFAYAETEDDEVVMSIGVVPEPSSLSLIGLGAGLLLRRRRTRR